MALVGGQGEDVIVFKCSRLTREAWYEGAPLLPSAERYPSTEWQLILVCENVLEPLLDFLVDLSSREL